MNQFKIYILRCWPILALITLSCRQAAPPPAETNPVILKVASNQVRLDAYQFYLECNYPEIIGQLDDDMHSYIFNKFKRDLFIAEVSQTLVRITDEQVEEFIRKNEEVFRAHSSTQSFHALSGKEQSLWRDEIRRRLAIQQFLQRQILNSAPIDDQEIVRYYEANEHAFEKETRYRLRIVQTGSREQADNFLKTLRKSKEPFLKVAANYATNEGYLLALPMRLEELPDPFRQEVRKLKPGGYSKVIPVNYGELDNYYVIFLESVDEGETISFEEAGGAIREKLEKQRYDQILSEKIQQFEHTVPVEVYPESLPFTLSDSPSLKEV